MANLAVATLFSLLGAELIVRVADDTDENGRFYFRGLPMRSCW